MFLNSYTVVILLNYNIYIQWLYVIFLTMSYSIHLIYWLYHYFIDYYYVLSIMMVSREKEVCKKFLGFLPLWWNIYALISKITSNTTKMRVTKTKLYILRCKEWREVTVNYFGRVKNV